MRSKEYWNNKIIEWEDSSYKGASAGVSLVEKVAARFRAPIRNRREVLLDVLAPHLKGASVVELGCGSGELCFQMLERGAGKVIGIDIADEAVKAASKRAARSNLGDRAAFFTLDINSDTGLPEADFVVGLGFIDYINIGSLKKLFAGIKGRFIFSFPEKKINMINALQHLYLKSQGCPQFYKFNKEDLKDVPGMNARCEFFTRNNLEFISNFDPYANTDPSKMPSLDIIIPARNEENDLKRCLDAIIRQDYPKDKLAITVVDGESDDSTAEVAKEYGCRVLINKERLAEPGVRLGITSSNSDLCCVIAVDNIIADESRFLKNMVRPFVEQGVAGAFPLVIYDDNEPAINKYITETAEPFSEFMYGSACNTKTFHLAYPSVFKNSRYSIFDYRKGAPPLLALAQGFIIRKDVFLSMPEPDGYDLVPIMALIKEGAPLAYVDSARLYHYQVMSLAAFIRKFRWRIRGNLRSGFQDRKLALMSPASRLKNRIRQYLWVAYSASIILPFIVSAVRCAKKRRLFYMYHFICNTVLIILMARELMGRKPEGTYK